MLKLTSTIRTTIGLGYIIVSLMGCASSPVTPQIDTKRNPVIDKPTQFQSPIQAIDNFLELNDGKYLKDHQVRQVKNSSLKILLGQQLVVARELKETGKLHLQPGYSYEKEYLDAHEDFPKNNPQSKSMDLFNNGKGIEYSSQYRGDDFENDLIQAGLGKIRDHDLRWIK